MLETKAINNAMASFLFIEIKFDLQNNGFFSEKLPSLHNFLKRTGLRQTQAPFLLGKTEVPEPVEGPTNKMQVWK